MYLLQLVRKAVTAGFFANACRLEVIFIFRWMVTFVKYLYYLLEFRHETWDIISCRDLFNLNCRILKLLF